MYHKCDAEAKTSESSEVGLPQAARLSHKLWDIDWSRYFPAQLPTSNLVVREVDLDEAAGFLARSDEQVFGRQGQWVQRKREDATLKQRYFQAACDAFGFWRERTIVGLFIGNPADWSSYYMRWLCLDPEFRKQRASTEFLEILFGALKAVGVARIECETAPSNVAGTAGLTSLGFRVAGMSLSERWGAMTRLYKHLDRQAEEAFVAAFGGGSRTS